MRDRRTIHRHNRVCLGGTGLGDTAGTNARQHLPGPAYPLLNSLHRTTDFHRARRLAWSTRRRARRVLLGPNDHWSGTPRVHASAPILEGGSNRRLWLGVPRGLARDTPCPTPGSRAAHVGIRRARLISTALGPANRGCCSASTVEALVAEAERVRRRRVIHLDNVNQPP